MLPKRLDRKTIYESQWINLYTDRVLMPSGKIIEKYHFLDYPNDSVVVLLTNDKNEMCFIKALRYTTQNIDWELPAGGIDKNEDILKAAEREVLEETGFKTRALKLRYSFNPSNGMSNQTTHVVIGEVDVSKQVDFDTDEVNEIHWLSIAKVKELVDNKEISDGISLIAILFYLNDVSHKNII
ncbi:MAG: NUDIX hydrolase [Candidatus Magasanikbacteria bacterium]